MKLHYSPTSPFVRKVLVAAMERGLGGQIERIDANPWDPADPLPASNPLGKVPVLTTDDGQVLFDSFVICSYLDGLGTAPPMIPEAAEAKLGVLRRHAAADGILDAAVLRLIEKARRPAQLRWAEWEANQKAKIDRSLDLLESEADALSEPLTLDQVTLGCALGYLDFRFAEEDWRGPHPKLAAWYAEFGARASMRDTRPPEA